jgi:hypothetical protein
MVNEDVEMEMELVTDPVEIAKARAQRQRCERNWDWLEANSEEVYRHRGRFVCIAGEELFVGDSLDEVIGKATAVHPEDDGRFTRYIPLERGPRIYADQWRVAIM